VGDVALNSERKIQEWTEPKSLAEYAEAAITDERGIRCPKCNCGHWKVVRTRDGTGMIKRKRVCQNPNCNYEMHTAEKPIGVPGKPV